MKVDKRNSRRNWTLIYHYVKLLIHQVNLSLTQISSKVVNAVASPQLHLEHLQ